MAKWIEEREPLTEQEVYEYLSENVESNARQWGENDIYTRWAREAREKKMAEFRSGKVVDVHHVSYCDSYGNGTGDYTDVLYSDGTVKTICYGYSD